MSPIMNYRFCLSQFEKEFQEGGGKDYLLSLCIAIVYINVASQVKNPPNRNAVITMVCVSYTIFYYSIVLINTTQRNIVIYLYDNIDATGIWFSPYLCQTPRRVSGVYVQHGKGIPPTWYNNNNNNNNNNKLISSIYSFI